MNNPPRKIIATILSIIDFDKDRDAFTDEFISLAQLQALVSLVKTLPEEEQKTIQSEFVTTPIASKDIHLSLHSLATDGSSSLTDTTSQQEKSEEFKKTIQKYFSEQEIEDAYSTALVDLLADWLKDILPDLSEEQQNKLRDFSRTLES